MRSACDARSAGFRKYSGAAYTNRDKGVSSTGLGVDLGEVGLGSTQRRVPEVQRRRIHQQGHHTRKVLHDIPVEHLPHRPSEHLPQLHVSACRPCMQNYVDTTQALETKDKAIRAAASSFAHCNLSPLGYVSVLVCLNCACGVAMAATPCKNLCWPHMAERVAERACWMKRWKALRRAWRSRRCRCRFRIICSAAPAGGSLNATSSAFTTSRCESGMIQSKGLLTVSAWELRDLGYAQRTRVHSGKHTHNFHEWDQLTSYSGHRCKAQTKKAGPSMCL